MKLYCVICSDLFDEFRKVSSTPCGHVFHDTCLYRWLEQSTSCPQCRHETTSLERFDLYLNYHQNHRELSNAFLENSYHDIQVQLHVKEQEYEAVKENFKNLADRYIRMEEAATVSKIQAMDSESREKVLNVKMKEMNQQIKQLKTCEGKNKNLEKKIERFQKEIATMSNSKQDLKNQVIGLKKEIHTKYATISDYICENKQLKELIAKLQSEKKILTKQIPAPPENCVNILPKESQKKKIKRTPTLKKATCETPVVSQVPGPSKRFSRFVVLNKKKLQHSRTKIHTRSHSKALAMKKKPPVGKSSLVANDNSVAEMSKVKKRKLI